MAKTKKNNISKKGAAIYIRVSTDAQFEEGYSVDAQKDRLTSYCQIKDIKIYDYYIDGGYTGSNMEMYDKLRDPNTPSWQTVAKLFNIKN